MAHAKHKIKIHPALKITGGFLLVILIGAFLLCLPIANESGTWLNFVDGLFTSTSAVCVTGLVVVDTAVAFTLFGQIVILLLIQIGGLGFITASTLVFLLIRKKIGYEQRKTIQEGLNQDNTQGVVKMIKKIILVTLIIEFAGFLCLLPSMLKYYGGGEGVFKALFLSISAFCNAGFDVLGTSANPFISLGGFASDVFVLIPIMLLIVLGGIGFVVLVDVFSKKEKNVKLSVHTKIVLTVTAALILIGANLFMIFEWNNAATIGNMSVFEKIINSLFQSITPRTAGFSTFNQANLSPASIALTNILMFIGGSPASTAGGIKTTTFFILILVMFKTANSKGDFVFFKKKISSKLASKSLKLFLLVITFIVSATFLISIFDPSFSFSQIFFECVSAVSTVGLSLGITPNLSVLSKIVLTILMFAGRVGAITFTLAIMPKNNITDVIEYPDAKIVVG